MTSSAGLPTQELANGSSTARVRYVAALLLVSTYPYVRFLGAIRSDRRAVVGYIAIDPLRVLAWAIFALLIGIGLMLLLRAMGSPIDQAGAAVLVVLFVAFSWEPIERLANAVSEATQMPLAGLLMRFVVFALAAFEGWRLGSSPIFLSVALAMLGVMTVVAGWQLLCCERLEAFPLQPGDGSFVTSLEGPPDVYLVIYDGYGSERALLDYSGFDNRDFIRRLVDKGLVVSDSATAVYSETVFSISSIFALDRPIPNGAFEPAERLAVRDQLMMQGPLTHIFLGAGYEVIHVENAWSIQECDGRSFDCRSSGLLNESDWAFLQSTILPELIPSLDIHPWPRSAVSQLDALTTIAQEDSLRPRLIMAHVLAPHPPFQLDAQCESYYDEELDGYQWSDDPDDLDARKRGYGDQIACINSLTTNWLEAVGSEAIVMIAGDHGSNYARQTNKAAHEWTEAEVQERFSVLLALRLPESCPMSEVSANPTDAARRVVNCAVGTELPAFHEPPHVVIANSDGSGVVTPVGR